MKLSLWSMILFAIALCLYVPISYRTEMVLKEQELNQSDERILLASCEAGLSEADTGKDEIFKSKYVREKAIESFYDTYCKNTHEDVNNAHNRIPCIVLMDWDGYYVCYTTPVDQADKSIVYTDALSEKLYWSKTYGSSGSGYIIEYRLDNNITVTKINAGGTKRFTGYYSEVLDKLNKAGFGSNDADVTVKTILTTYSAFTEEKKSVVLSLTDEKINYFINAHNDLYNAKQRRYIFSMPQSEDTKDARVLETPSMIAFAQGAQTDTEREIVNSYALVGTDLDVEPLYCINYMINGSDGSGNPMYGYMYHKAGCEELNSHMAIRIDSMEGCARSGAQPHSCISHHDENERLYENYNNCLFSGEDVVKIIEKQKGKTIRIIINDGNQFDCATVSWSALEKSLSNKSHDNYIDPQGLYGCEIRTNDYDPNGNVMRLRFAVANQ